MQKSTFKFNVEKFISAHCLPGILVIVLTFIGQHVNISVLVLTLAVTMIGALSTGHYQNPIDIAPNFAGKIKAHWFLFTLLQCKKSQFIYVIITCFRFFDGRS